ncbi:MAG: steroid 3-ketoacyl-CoA thiolase, partial [Solirubrobacteraceae bacterium]
ARLIATLLHELERAEKEIGLVTMCCGGGLGTATLIQRVD